MSLRDWMLWALILVIQNVSFTLVSRARNSGSLRRHMVASLLSNGVWFLSQVVLVNEVMPMLSGSRGAWMLAMAGSWYTAFTMCGAWAGHWWSLRNESGSAAVGASRKYAQITSEEWEMVKQRIGGQPK